MKKHIITALILFISSNTFATSEGFVGNAGDPCEQRILEISRNLLDWLDNDEHIKSNLSFKPGHNHTLYRSSMEASLKETVVSCTSETLFFKSSEKVCLNFVDENKQKRIKCNRSSFLNLGEEDQYRFIHHEYAGIAGLEENLGKETSNYFYSDQISARLQDHVVKKLSIMGSGHNNTLIESLTTVNIGQVSSEEFEFCRFKIQHKFKYKTKYSDCYKTKRASSEYIKSKAALELEHPNGKRYNLFLGKVMDGNGSWYDMSKPGGARGIYEMSIFAMVLTSITPYNPGKVHCKKSNVIDFSPLDHIDLAQYALNEERVHISSSEAKDRGIGLKRYNRCRKRLGLDESKD